MSIKDDARVYATASAMGKAIEDFRKDTAANLKAELAEQYEEAGQDRVNIPWPGGTAYVTLSPGRRTYEGNGPGFLEFMREKGMTREEVGPEWTDLIEERDGRIIWAETGEVVPGASVREGAAYVALKGLKASDRLAFIDHMRHEGLGGADMPLLGGTND